MLNLHLRVDPAGPSIQPRYGPHDPPAADHLDGNPVVYCWVAEADDRFRALLSRGPVIDASETAWWRSRLPAMVGEEMRADVLRVLGVTMERPQ